ncbi:PIN domain-containing protein [Pedobacter sp. BS3]|uniref:PIN domain-containing protein n=1 Tax=Pedobacter sp. BS3 TaxID=2567937 RepID=UPI0018D96364
MLEGRTIQFIAPSHLIDEIKEHTERLTSAIGKTPKEVSAMFKKLLNGVKIIEISAIPNEYIRLAEDIVKDIDPDDVFFVAFHFYKKHKIWIGDTKLVLGLKAKGYNICVTTAQLKRRLYKKQRSKFLLPVKLCYPAR